MMAVVTALVTLNTTIKQYRSAAASCSGMMTLKIKRMEARAGFKNATT